MGRRVEGKKKKKGVKANVTSKFSAKRKLSRMGKKVKKGQMGPNTEFITRSAALKRLQITLKDFRRLCILKGIYPRVPAKGSKGNDKVYYDIKDLSYLAHEPLLKKFREFKAFMKKIRRAAGRNQFGEARRRDELKPVFALDHLVKERYPRFIDALRDLDDALCMIHLFAALPSEGRITAARTATCKQLAQHWQYYIARSRSLHKVFVSVKGVYFQAEVMGEPITWLVPHQFTQVIPREVDTRVMLTFLDFYEVFIRFTLFKLYHMAGFRYPPTSDKALQDAGCCLLAVKASPLEVEGVEADSAGSSTQEATHAEEVQMSGSGTGTGIGAKDGAKDKKRRAADAASAARLATLATKLKDLEDLDEDDEESVDLAAPLAAAFSDLQGGDEDGGLTGDEQKTFAMESEDVRPRLFAKLKFFFNREVPLEWLQLCTVSFGATVGWESPASPFTESDEGITHHVVDRPMQAAQLRAGREYVQPQWVFDCINAQVLLPTHRYRPGAALPPHLSPFVDDEKEGYTPQYREELRQLQSAAGGDSSTVGSSGRKIIEKEVLGDDSEDEETAMEMYEKELQAERDSRKAGRKSISKRARQESDDDEEEVEEDESADDEEQSKVAATHKGPKGVVFKPAEKAVSEEEEAHELSKLMMSKKTKRLYGRMQNSIQQKQGALEKLKEKRAALDASSSTSSTKTEDSKQKSSTRSKNAKSEPKAVSKKQKVAGNK